LIYGVKILYFSFSSLDISSNVVYIQGLRKNGVEVVEFHTKPVGIRKYREILSFYFKNRKNADFLMVGYHSPQIVMILKLFSRKAIVYNALCSVWERMVLSRSLIPRFSIKSLYYWLLDFFATQFSRLVMVETENQLKFFQKYFFLPKNKLFRALTGADETKFFYDPAIQKFPEFTVVFRGRLLPEAGAELIIPAAKQLEDKGVKFLMLASGYDLPKILKTIEEQKPKNLQLISDFLPIEELRKRMLASHLSLGQLSAHPRLERTIPHKAYDSLATKIPYLTARSAGIMELLTEGETCLAFNPGDAGDLAAKILWARDHREEIKEIGEKGWQLFQRELTAKHLAKNFLEELNK